ncbi:MAG: hypothetical protein ACD_45C00668G0002 [uncultured bacterium]|nr:MAG: hypothetical protein ACD_45C00668G0002 [uncultured bacterium]OGT46442.1 MAG: hypothetical protein A3E82_00810 [Gammaproteobacteria bacterium RIFCSPHIGHO2_12_FULL_38_11]
MSNICQIPANNKTINNTLDEFHYFITADGTSDFKAEPGRYHLYASLACPWAHRTLIFRKLKKLEDMISLSIVDPVMDENGWMFSDGPHCIPDTVNHFKYLREVYMKAKNDFKGRVTVPVLWDKQKQTIVNNESSEIIRMFNAEFNTCTDATIDFYPEHLRNEIDQINHIIFTSVNSGVYKAGFAEKQDDYNVAFDALFKTLDFIEERLSKKRYLVGNIITEADWRLFTTLIRFDAVYYIHFKCSLYRMIN